MTKQIPFGIRFKGQWDTYTSVEVSNYIECADSIDDADLRERYISFLKDVFLEKKCNPSTLVDHDVLVTFYQDIDNRADIDYREGHYDRLDEPVQYYGGMYFHQIAGKLKRHLANHR